MKSYRRLSVFVLFLLSLNIYAWENPPEGVESYSMEESSLVPKFIQNMIRSEKRVVEGYNLANLVNVKDPLNNYAMKFYKREEAITLDFTEYEFQESIDLGGGHATGLFEVSEVQVDGKTYFVRQSAQLGAHKRFEEYIFYGKTYYEVNGSGFCEKVLWFKDRLECHIGGEIIDLGHDGKPLGKPSFVKSYNEKVLLCDQKMIDTFYAANAPRIAKLGGRTGAYGIGSPYVFNFNETLKENYGDTYDQISSLMLEQGTRDELPFFKGCRLGIKHAGGCGFDGGSQLDFQAANLERPGIYARRRHDPENAETVNFIEEVGMRCDKIYYASGKVYCDDKAIPFMETCALGSFQEKKFISGETAAPSSNIYMGPRIPQKDSGDSDYGYDGDNSARKTQKY